MSATANLALLLEPIHPHLERIEQLLYETLAGAGEPLGPKLCSMLGSGKRLRPALVILASEVFAPSNERFCVLATAVETLHTATLIHDDLVDGSPLRRGRNTLHTTWPVGATVLAGDYLLAQAAALVARLESPRILGIFAEALSTMCIGEIRQMFPQEGAESRRQAYYQRIEAKTASLCAAATEMAGMLAGAAEPHLLALRQFGYELGVAFQMVDDVLDFSADEAQLGKPAGSDLRQGLVTLPVLCYMEADNDRSPVEAVLAGQHGAAHMQAAIDAVRTSGAVEAALAEAYTHVRLSQKALVALPDHPAREMLHALADYVVRRQS